MSRLERMLWRKHIFSVLHLGHSSPLRLVKYLIGQDTHVTSTITKHNITLVRLGNLLSLQPRSTIQVNIDFSVPSNE